MSGWGHRSRRRPWLERTVRSVLLSGGRVGLRRRRQAASASSGSGRHCRAGVRALPSTLGSMSHSFADEAGSTDHAAEFAAIVDDGLLQCLDDLDLQREHLAEPAPRDRIENDGCGELGTPQRAEAGIVDECVAASR